MHVFLWSKYHPSKNTVVGVPQMQLSGRNQQGGVIDMCGPVTLADLVRENKLLWVYCCDCGHERDVNPAMVSLPAETPVPEVGQAHEVFGLRLAKDQHQA